MSVDEKKSVLVVDDDPTVRKLLGFRLKSNNFIVYEAEGPAKAFELLAAYNIDLVLCDVSMEEMDGFTFCRRVRENEEYKILPFIFVTANNTIEDKSKALEAGGDDIITKPFDIKELLLKVQALLRRMDIYKVYGAKKNLEKAFTDSAVKILLVDDDISLTKLFQYSLNKAGFECTVADGAEEGFKIAKEINPSIIISDVMMPDIDGFEFRKMLLNEPQLRSIPFIFLTAKGEENDILDGYELGIAEYVLKTAGPRVVIAKVSAIVKSLGSERDKIVSELHSAADSLRVKVVPDAAPEFDGFIIKYWHVPFQGIPGGDFIDFFNLDENNLVVILGDVMGKKWGAWYFAFAYAGYIRSAIRVALQTAKEFSPGAILEQVNNSVYQDARISEVFATLSLAIINRVDKTIKYSGAGDLPLLFHNKTTGEIKKIKSDGLLLGFAAGGCYTDSIVQLNRDDIIIMYTDGIQETTNAAGEQFGKEKLNEVLMQGEFLQCPLEKIKNGLISFSQNKFEDDISLIVIKAE